MDTLINNYGRLIDQIRKDRNISRVDLCEDIMSVRNFQRFSTGDVSVSNDKIVKLIDRLNLDYFTFQEIYKSKYENEYSKLKEAFNLAVKWEYKKALVELSKVDKDTITSSFNNQMYNYTEVFIKKGNDLISDSEFTSRIESIIDYPNILKNKIINVIELNALFSLNTKLYLKKDRSIVDFFINCVQNDNFKTYWINSEVLSSIYATISKTLYSLEEYETCLEYCEVGLKYCRSTERLVGFANLLGYKALAYNKLGFQSEAIDAAIKTYMELIVEDNKSKTNMFVKIIESNLNIKFSEIISIKKEM